MELSARSKLLLHTCCAPCASYALEYLSPSYEITTFFYNPNILPGEEHGRRAAELGRLLALARYPNPVGSLGCRYDPEAFGVAAGPYEDEPEGGERCRICFELRLGETARRAEEGGYGYFATTLSVSPHKDAGQINEIGGRLERKYVAGGPGYLRQAPRYLPLDLKKGGGFKRSVELSKLHGLYRQGYCGCRPAFAK